MSDVKVPKFTWDANDEIIIRGLDWQEIYNASKKIYEAIDHDQMEFKGTSKLEMYAAIYSMAQSLDRTFAKAVETGVIKKEEQ